MATKRVCSWTGCPTVVPGGQRMGNYCSIHMPLVVAAIDKRRGTRQERGYGKEHDAERRRWRQLMERGMVVRCARCLERVDPSQPWDLGHVPGDKTRWQGPEHVRCSRSANQGN